MKGFNSKILVFGAIATILLIAIIMPSVPSASAGPPTNCIWQKTNTGVYDWIVVPAGTECSMIKGVVVNGDIMIRQGASFSANGISIGGDVDAFKAASVSITGSTVAGDIIIEDTNWASTMSISKNIVTGDIRLINNNIENGITVVENIVDGNVLITGNYADSFIMIGGNTITGNLDCDTNIPHDFYGDVIDMVTIRGLNTVTGVKTGQCAGM